ncbi:hypothetical protein phiCbK_158 [Caulobacter phage phiCbK]|uniref:Uncharacterized protein n=4 Tax=Shapirovirus cbk TaxID=1204537 RepID=J3U9K3_9CAUD|nr:hypothetical protein D865_gp254 [Caulobacter phage phiCbK]AFO71673.1 hypothetical protein phiCbK_158 [Caulobacter phage phiCbK]AFU86996.1 hypothetical protein CbK_gp164 [Caulobacter phage phiCbK]ARB15077.1 hypothetical protein Ccr32_gp159 [Caulobacter phage Ccr32]ARB15411.1 hypothetical protein Ccr34_gp169 [Caulobacter phage Ccr34]
MSRGMTETITYAVFDIETGGLGQPSPPIEFKKVTAPRREVKLDWVDASYADGVSIRDAERHREFPHLGAAIAWARRRIFHGEVFGDVIDLTLVERDFVRDQLTVKTRQFAVRMNGFSELSGYGGRSLDENKPIRRIRPGFRMRGKR